MKKALVGVVTLAVALGAAATSFAATQDSAKEECFAKHSQLMSKPSVKTIRDCWNAHRHLMQ